jgi:hypothetical protein
MSAVVSTVHILSLIVAGGQDLGSWLMPAAAATGAVTALLIRGRRQRRR